MNGHFATTWMALELLIADFLFARSLGRKPYFWLRWISAVAICLCITFWVEVYYFIINEREFIYGGGTWAGDSVFKFVYYTAIFLITVVCVKCCYQSSWWNTLFFCSGAYAMQHLASNLAAMLRLIPQFGGSERRMDLLNVLVFALVYLLIYVLIIRRIRGENVGQKNIRRKVFMSLIIILTCIGLSRITIDDSTRGFYAVIAETLYAIICCLLTINMLFDLTENDSMQYETEVMAELLHREREQYRLSKENIDLINIKCHDLKHQIAALRGGSDEYVREVENAVMIYGSVAKTGNDVLDVILTEKSLYCDKNGILLSYMVKGEDLSFMDDMDIYSLFGNALSNAIEGAKGMEEPARRCITLNVQRLGGVLSVHMENFYSGTLKIEDGLPATAGDRDYHGFGIKSMQRIAQKYNGEMDISVREGRFLLDIILCVPERPCGKDAQEDRVRCGAKPEREV